ncbi:MAG: hypothetical protein V4760_15370 [Bdellovibrionota bacterium]
MKHFATLILVLGALIGAREAKAQGYVRAEAMYLSSGGGSGSIDKTTRTLIDVGAGFAHADGWTLGFLYGTEAVNYSSTSPSTNRASFGPSVGWMQGPMNGVYTMFTYFLTSTYSSYKGTGYQLDVGYQVPLGKVGLGVQLSYKRFKYPESGGATISPAYEQEFVDPYFTINVAL